MDVVSRSSDAARAMLLIGLFAVLWAIIESIGGYAGVPGQEVVFVRYGTQLAVMLVLCGPRVGTRLYRTRRPVLQVIRSIAMFGMPLLFLAAAARVALNTAWSIFWIAPLLIMALDRRAAGGATRWIAAAAGFAGVLLILQPERDVTPGALVLAGGMAVCFAFYQVLTRIVADEPEVTNLFHTAFWVFLLLSPFVLLAWHRPTPLGWADLVTIGLLGFGALVALDVALRLASPALIAPVFYVQPAATRLIAWAVHGTPLSIASIIGCLVILVSMFVSSRSPGVATRPAIA